MAKGNILENRVEVLEKALAEQQQLIMQLKETTQLLISQLTHFRSIGAEEDGALSLEEAANYLGYSASFIARQVSSKAIPYYRRPNRTIFFLKSDLHAWAEGRDDKRIRHVSV